MKRLLFAVLLVLAVADQAFAWGMPNYPPGCNQATWFLWKIGLGPDCRT